VASETKTSSTGTSRAGMLVGVAETMPAKAMREAMMVEECIVLCEIG